MGDRHKNPLARLEAANPLPGGGERSAEHHRAAERLLEAIVGESRAPHPRRRAGLLRPRRLACAVAAIVGLGACLGYAADRMLTPPDVAVVAGVVQPPPAIAQQTARLNRVLEACLVQHGAVRVPVGARGWIYRDPGRAAARACTGPQRAVDDYASGPEVSRAHSMMNPVVDRYSACLRAQGIGRPHAGVTDTASLEWAESLCTERVNRDLPDRSARP